MKVPNTDNAPAWGRKDFPLQSIELHFGEQRLESRIAVKIAR
jgi:hypothetical protein